MAEGALLYLADSAQHLLAEEAGLLEELVCLPLEEEAGVVRRLELL